MGPGDPFAKRNQTPEFEASRAEESVQQRNPPARPPSAPPTRDGISGPSNADADFQEDRRMDVESSNIMSAVATIVGLILGVVFGLVLLLASPWGALLVLLSGAIGAALGTAVFAVATKRVDLGGAWRALLRR